MTDTMPADGGAFRKNHLNISTSIEPGSCDLFQHLFADWLTVYSDYERPTEDDEVDFRRRHNKLMEATAAVMTFSATEPFMVWNKIKIFETFLHGDGTCEWTDHRSVWHWACIKADLMRLSISREA